ncbi:MAG: preprotein translocase subunit SecG [Candidatus Entotheonella gemina]|uniref:Protein-export membrane protein SecG n=1 Tax=Candidatus Entotheonella gemina TaxID=1429439 RepID=W4M3X4_9BACT|nr:MAG: preprotein translocase subunit SecG [Candidatus Entotheonella gemina]
MNIIVVVLHTLVALTLIAVVLLQVGKGGSIGAAFGGGGSSQTLFGSRGPATFLSRLTTAAAAVFMITSLALAYLSSSARQSSSITDQVPAGIEQQVPASDATQEAPAATPEPDAATAPSQEGDTQKQQ